MLSLTTLTQAVLARDPPIFSGDVCLWHLTTLTTGSFGVSIPDFVDVMS